MLLRVSLPLALLTLTLVGCSGSGRLNADSPEEAYTRGLAAFERGKCDRAAEYFTAVIDFSRSNDWADDAQFYLGRSYQCNKEYLLAATEYARFLQLYSTDPRAEEAAFYRLESYYAQSPSYQLDQTPTHQAIDYIRLFVQRYPQSERVPQAAAMLDELVEKLARKQYEAGALYLRREYFEASALSFLTVLERYPASPYADDALVGALEAYTLFAENSIRARQAERFQKGIDVYNQLVQLFPNSPLLRDAEAIYVRAQRGLDAVASN